MTLLRAGHFTAMSLLLASSAIAGASGSASVGPFNATFLEGGLGLTRTIDGEAPWVIAEASFSVTGWIRPERRQQGQVIIAALGDPASPACRCILLDDGKPALRVGNQLVASRARLEPETWHAIGAVFEAAGTKLYVDGRLVASGPAATGTSRSTIELAPVAPGTTGLEGAHFAGSIAQLRIGSGVLSAKDVARLTSDRPNFDLVNFARPGVGWSVQTRQQAGLKDPQDPATLPHGKAGFSKPLAKPEAKLPALERIDQQRWRINGWRLAEGPTIKAGGGDLSRPGFGDRSWFPATVPGTILQTLIDRGVYPDPDYGLNNLAIPERLAHQDYWYRTEFEVPAAAPGKKREILFKGINYAAEVWLNGEKLGGIRGAFVRGRFDVSGKLRPGRNALAVRISPPPHAGIPHEESIAAGPGENGGMVALDGPTFAATEGWDWIPGIRDRNSGIWQEVDLAETGDIQIGDPKVTTDLPLPRTDSARVTIEVPVTNSSDAPVTARVSAQFESVDVGKTATVAPGQSTITLSPDEFPQLTLQNPRLWWPNGYGDPALYHLNLSAETGGVVSDAKSLRFGVREYSYELSLFDSVGSLRRVEVDFTDGKPGEKLVDVRHEAIKQSPNGWVESLTAEGERSPAVRPVQATSPLPHLAIRVNGVRIAARGGSWGMDDMLKRISRIRLEPYFRLHREANVNIIRNWMGTNTEDVFYDLADEYGLMVLNDFWDSTQDFQLEAQDPQLFLANARDTISRYRTHPSIVIWFGRNEGVPQPVLNEGLDDLVTELDRTRWYTGSSNTVNLQGSGPYNYRPPVGYFTDLASGFSVETGSPSLATFEALKAMIPPEDRWPLSDTIAYHDWHFGGNGDVKTFMDTLARQFGAPTSLEDFERKAQMMNFVTYRAIFEGMAAHLWTKNMGRLLWMTQPAWPSNHWQIYSHDYDTHASFYGVKHGSEPVHAQMNLPDYALAVVNTTREPLNGLKLESEVYDLQGRSLFRRTDLVSAAVDATTTLAALPLQSLLDSNGLVLVKLRLVAANSALLSDNFYWQGKDDAGYRLLNSLKPQPLTADATFVSEYGENVVRVRLLNSGNGPLLQAKLTILDKRGERILPAYYSDNYVSLLAGETRDVEIRLPKGAATPAEIGLRGWNVQPREVDVKAVP